VRQLQECLLQLGYNELMVTGTFDERTLRAVELFQLQHVDERGRPLKSDGEVGRRTWWALANPSGEMQRSHVPSPQRTGLTSRRTRLLELLDEEHKKPVCERPDGTNRSPDIDRYFGKTGIRGKPWCCAFVSWALQEVTGGLPIGGQYHLGVQVMWVQAHSLGLEVVTPKPGDVFVQLKSGGTGHTGFVVGLSHDEQVVYTCEGNCGNRLKYGQRPRDTIHHYIDALADGQGEDFPRGADLVFDDVELDDTR
jgi:hypothetical protein